MLRTIEEGAWAAGAYVAACCVFSLAGAVLAGWPAMLAGAVSAAIGLAGLVLYAKGRWTACR